MWMKWLPWRFLVSKAAKSHGFLDPVSLFSRLSLFSQPSEVKIPLELLRLGAALHARGLINNHVIQHNLDWIWPLWVEEQFNPRKASFIPRAFSLTHVNLTHRNWTALGIPGLDKFPLVDSCGLVTPFLDGWSIDSWIIRADGKNLIPSKMCEAVCQSLFFEDTLAVKTGIDLSHVKLRQHAEMVEEEGVFNCKINLEAFSDKEAFLAVSVRPYNPEGISFIHEIEVLKNRNGWKVNNESEIYFSEEPRKHIFSDYKNGDVYRSITADDDKQKIKCEVGMATGAALFKIESGTEKTLTVNIPVAKKKKHALKTGAANIPSWKDIFKNTCELNVPDESFNYLYATSLRTLVLLSAAGSFAGPYTYKYFWFRDAAFIVYALASAGLTEIAEEIINRYPEKMTLNGYFFSQRGEWDSNGQVLWSIAKFYEMTGKRPYGANAEVVHKAARWIIKKRLPSSLKTPCAGLLPAGFSAEHFGPSDYYYWDDFWGAAGLKAAAILCRAGADDNNAALFENEADDFMKSIKMSIEKVCEQKKDAAIPASPYRRMDSGAIGSVVSGYPLKLYEANDANLSATIEYLMKNCLVKGAFFHDISHSGINPYLTLHIAQVLLRAGDKRFFDLVKSIADLASPAGQWPEAVHPKTLGGCMGDGQHVWAAAEWVLMTRNCFAREEKDKLILCSGVPKAWCQKNKTVSFGPALTDFGKISVFIKTYDEKIVVSWQAEWREKEPVIEVRLDGFSPVIAGEGREFVEFLGGDGK
ncbi:MAG: hypothetical protein ABH836_06860 [Candidatus Omnitrophota bacterium]